MRLKGRIIKMLTKKILLTPCFLFILYGCGTIPASGPYSSDMKQSGKVSIKLANYKTEDSEVFNYAVADISSGLLDFLATENAKLLNNYKWPEKEPAEEIKVNVGDTIQISIFESQSGGLFIPVDSGTRPGNYVSLPPQTIDFSGEITVPYAGKIQAAGQTTEQIGASIEKRLADKAIEPQIVVSFANRNGAEISVIGNVNQARRIPLGFNNFKILDAIASAGGPAAPGYETKVSLQRDEQEYTIPFDSLVMAPEKNIYSKINDIIYLYREPKTFSAYGAVSSPGNIPFGKRDLMLSEAMGLARGLRDDQADPAEIYIYRQQKYDYFTEGSSQSDKSSVRKTYSNISMSDENRTAMNNNKTIVKTVEDESDIMAEDGKISVIFKLDMRKPSSLFLAQKFAMQEQDIIYVANAESVEFLKFLNIVSSSSTSKINTDNAF